MRQVDLFKIISIRYECSNPSNLFKQKIIIHELKMCIFLNDYNGKLKI